MSASNCKICELKASEGYIEVLENILSVFSCIPQHTLKMIKTFNYNQYEKLKFDRIKVVHQLRNAKNMECDCGNSNHQINSTLSSKNININSETSTSFNRKLSSAVLNSSQKQTENISCPESDFNNDIFVPKATKKFTFKKPTTSVLESVKEDNKANGFCKNTFSLNKPSLVSSTKLNLSLKLNNSQSATNTNLIRKPIVNTNLNANNVHVENKSLNSANTATNLNVSSVDVENKTVDSPNSATSTKKKFVFKKKPASLNDTIINISSGSESTFCDSPVVQNLPSTSKAFQNSKISDTRSLFVEKSPETSSGSSNFSSNQKSDEIDTNNVLDHDGWQIYRPEDFDAIDSSINEALQKENHEEDEGEFTDDYDQINASIAAGWEPEESKKRNVYTFNDNIDNLFESSMIEIRNAEPVDNANGIREEAVYYYF